MNNGIRMFFASQMCLYCAMQHSLNMPELSEWDCLALYMYLHINIYP